MSRRVFFSFHHARDAWRAGQVRNCNLIANEDEYGFIDSVDWEKLKRQGGDAVKRWIQRQLQHTSVTVVLIGTQTANREWVKYEIIESWKRGNGLVGVTIHNIRTQFQQTDIPGRNPFADIQFDNGSRMSSVVKTYDWVLHRGRLNLGKWVEEAYASRH